MRTVSVVGVALAFFAGCTDDQKEREKKMAEVELCLHERLTGEREFAAASIRWSPNEVFVEVQRTQSIIPGKKTIPAPEEGRQRFRAECMPDGKPVLCAWRFPSSHTSRYSIRLEQDGIYRITASHTTQGPGEHFFSPEPGAAEPISRTNPALDTVEHRLSFAAALKNRLNRPFIPVPELEKQGLGTWYFAGSGSTGGGNWEGTGSRDCAVTSSPERLPEPFGRIAKGMKPEPLQPGYTGQAPDYRSRGDCDNLDHPPAPPSSDPWKKNDRPFRESIEALAETARVCMP
ncbi:MAG: hypothetical protein M3O22_03565 [Pseudomonadota bacterium]|nr:hypothetical protein [Pseudomonadota bacterium]